MNKPSTSIDTAAPPRPVASSPTVRASSKRAPTHENGSAPVSGTLTDLSFMLTRAHAIRGRGSMARDLDQRLTGVSAELESLIHDVLHDTDPASNGSRGSRTRGAVPDPASDPGPTRMEAAFEA